MSKARELAELGAVYDSGALSNRNLFINGAMQVFQRGTSFSGTNAYNADRWLVDDNQDGGGQSTDAPDGFTYSLKINPTSGQNAALRQAIELPAAGEGGVFRSGQKFTLSFYLKSDNAGEAINIFAASGTSVTATTTSQVNDTSTGLTTTTSWARYTYTFTSNNVGGSDTCYNIVPYVTTPSGAVYWTGFQLELGTEATPFEQRSVGDELIRCQRYFQKWLADTASDSVCTGSMISDTGFIGEYFFSNTMRATPSLSQSGTYQVRIKSNDRATGSISINRGTTDQVQLFSSLSADNNEIGLACFIKGTSSGDFLEFDAEL